MENNNGLNFCLIMNPAAGSVKKLSSRKNLTDKLQADFFSATGTELPIYETLYPGHATLLAKESAAAGFSACLAMGGDGTMNEVASGLLGTQTALGFIPMGSGNGLARHLGYDMDPIRALRQCLKAFRVQADVGKCGERYFFLAAGMGFEGTVAHAFAKQKERGFFQYIRSSAINFFHYRAETFSFEADGKKETVSPFTLTMANGSQYGNNAIIAPGASVCDGQLELVVICEFPFWAAPWLFFRLMNGSISRSVYHESSKVRSLVFHLEKPSEGHLDGEPVVFDGRLEFSVLPAAVTLLSPKKAGEI